ncbi:TPA: hypothetical protein DCZ36_02800 [Candidatus Gracilibacteria bacterium]|nr:hypothetical protein [Candidatus Gracilibacteria bacterium]
MSIRIPLLKIIQNSIPLYGFILKANYVYEHFDVSRRIEDKEEGYQRSFSKKKINDIKKYLNENNGIIPNSVLVTLEKDKFVIHDDNTIEFQDDPSIGLIIDGQHRVKGAYEAGNNIDLFIIGVEGLTIPDQAKLFIKINSTQKGVPVSLYLDLLNLTEGEIEDFDDEDVPAERRSIEIATRLNEEADSPLVGKIRMTGDVGVGISLSELVTKTREYVNPKGGVFQEFGFEEQYNIFKIFFKVVSVVFSDEWDNPDSLILKTVGFGGLLKALREIFAITIRNNAEFSEESLSKVLSLISDFKFNKETLPGGGITAQDNAGSIIVTTIKKRLTDNYIPRVKIG